MDSAALSDVPPVSVVVPFFNEEESVQPVLEELRRCLPDAEIIAVDDGSKDRTWELITAMTDIRGLRLTENRGQSGALYAGLRAARAPICAMMDGDGQNDPADLPKMVEVVQRGEADVVVGRRAKRRDTWSRRVASKVANRIRRSFLDDGVHDTGCSLKVFKKEAVELLVPFNGLHRYLPAIFKHAGLRMTEIPVNHRARERGTSKYTNWDRALRGIYDLVGVSWLLKRKVVFPAIEDTGKQSQS
ncbi:MAG: dolichol-phosphate mannosyltransferase [Puniceicoccaceae bacterium 5H]|nr:MAG: dolichol-phosphate mannosyltransferase [Puniceicoccaceae bacterium 5H]